MKIKKIIVLASLIIVFPYTVIHSGILHDAIKEGNIEKVEQLLAQGFSDEDIRQAYINENKDGVTPLHIAAQNGYTSLVKLLLEQGAAKDSKDKNGATPLHVAVKYGHTKVIKRLFKYGAQIEVQNEHGYTPLHIALLNGHTNLVELFLQQDVTLDKPDKNGNTLLHYAVKQNNNTIVSFLLDHGTDLTTQNKYGVTPLHAAAENGHASIVKLLLAHNAPVNIKNKNGETPLYCASKCDHEEVVKLLKSKMQSEESPKYHFDSSASDEPAGPASFGKYTSSNSLPTQQLRSFGISIDPANQERLQTFQQQLTESHIDLNSLAASASFVQQWKRELKTIVHREQRFAITHQEQQALLSDPNVNIGDYYEVLWSRLSNTILACKVMNSEHVANDFKNNFETAAKILHTATHVSLIGPFAGLLSGILGFIADGQKKQAVMNIAHLMHTCKEIDITTEEVARRLTNDIRSKKLHEMQLTTDLLLPERFKKKWHYLRGEECTTKAKRLAKKDADMIIQAIANDVGGIFRESDMIIKLIQCVEPNYIIASSVHTSETPTITPSTASLPMQTTHKTKKTLIPIVKPANDDIIATMQMELDLLKKQLGETTKILKQTRKNAAQTMKVRLLEKQLEELRKKIEGQETNTGGTLIFAREKGQHRPHDILVLQQDVSELRDGVATVASTLAQLQKDPNFAYLKSPEHTIHLSQTDLVDELIEAFKVDNVRCVRLLLRTVVNPTTHTADDNNIFHLAVEHKAHDCLSHLLTNLASSVTADLLSTQNNDGKIPFELIDPDDIETGTLLKQYLEEKSGKGKERAE